MRNLTIYLGLVLCLFFNTINAQETFEARAKAIAEKIEQIVKEEKAALKQEIEAVNIQLQSGAITNQQSDERKIKMAESRAKNIENRVAEQEVKLTYLVKEKTEEHSGGTYISVFSSNDSIKDGGTQINIPSMKVYKGSKDRQDKLSRRTTSQFVFAAGFNNLVTYKHAAHSDYRYFGSHFYEWGLSANTRMFKNANLLHFKYGLSVMYNNLRPTDNRAFVVNGDQTNLEVSPIKLEDSRFRNVYLVAPIHLEFDFSGKKKINDKFVFQSHKAFRLGFGGYAGINLKSKQILNYEDANGEDVRDVKRGDFNSSDYIYGVSTYIGYKETSLYVKYDLNPLFKDNAIDQNNISLGIRFDFN